MVYPVVWSVKELAEIIDRRRKNKFDAIIFVTGGTGTGKTTFLHKLFFKFPDFKIKDKITWKRDEMINLIKNFKFSYCWNDEMISSGNKRRFYDIEQIELIEVLTKYRSNFNVVAGAVPIFFSLDKELLKLVGMHIHIIERGIGIVHLPRDGRMYNDDPWDIRQNSKLEEKWSAKVQKNPNFKIPYHKYTTFAGYVYFGKMTEQQEIQYEEIRKIKRGDLDTPIESNTQENFYERVIKLLKDGNLDESSLLSLCLYDGKKLSNVRVRLNQMLKDSGDKRTLKDFFNENKKDTKDNTLHNNSSIKELLNIEPPTPKS